MQNTNFQDWPYIISNVNLYQIQGQKIGNLCRNLYMHLKELQMGMQCGFLKMILNWPEFID